MQAVILAAGRGARLSPLTDDIPKVLVEVDGVSFLENSLRALHERTNVVEVIIVVGYLREQVMSKFGAFFPAGDSKPLKIRWVENDKWDSTNNIYSLWMAAELLRGDFILLEGDVFFEYRLLDELLQAAETGEGGSSIVLVAPWEAHMDGTVVTVDSRSNRILRLVPGASQEPTFDFSRSFKTINIYYFTGDLFRRYFRPNLNLYVNQSQDLSQFWELILGVLIYLQVPRLFVKVVDRTLKWYEVDDARDLDAANFMFAPIDRQLALISGQFGGYWRYSSFIDFCYLFNLYFPPQALYDQLGAELKPLIQNYPLGHGKIAEMLARFYKDSTFNKANLCVLNGAAEFIRIFNRQIVKKVTVAVPTFNEYKDVGEGQLNEVRLPRENNFDLDVNAFCKSVIDSGSNAAVLINPNNPTGRHLTRLQVECVLQQLAGHVDLVVVDESFVDFVGDRDLYSVQPLIKTYQHLAVVRSLSKEFGVPGLRLGYVATTNVAVKRIVRDFCPVWNTNALAERFLELFPKYAKDYARSLTRVIADREEFFRALQEVQYVSVIPSSANFFLCEIKERKFKSPELARALFKKGFFVKDCSNRPSLGDSFIRIAVRKPEENRALIRALLELGGNAT